jgi:hypothetical protein
LCGEQGDRLGNSFHLHRPDLIEFDGDGQDFVGRDRVGEEDSSGTGVVGNPGCHVDGPAEVVAVSEDDGSGVEANACAGQIAFRRLLYQG